MDLQKFNEECLKQHNFLRGLHGCPPLEYDEELAKAAQHHADHLVEHKSFEHSHVHDTGENIATKCAGKDGIMTGEEASNMWYSEIKDYDFNLGTEQNECGHFSQVVWMETKNAGFGYAKDPDTHQIKVVGQYSPSGNFVGKWGANIPAPLDGKKWKPEGTNTFEGDDPDDFCCKTAKKMKKDSTGKVTKLVIRTFQRKDGSTYEKEYPE